MSRTRLAIKNVPRPIVRALSERLREFDRRKPTVEPSVFTDNSQRPAAELFKGRIIYIGGTTNQFQISDGSMWNIINVIGGGTAPVGATYLLLSGNAALTQERILTAGTAVSFADTGANGTLTVNHAQVTTGDLHQDYLLAAGTRSLTGDWTWADGVDVTVGSGSGTKIGTGAGQKLGFFNHAPSAQPAAYTPTNVTTDRSYDANATTIDELADVLGTLISDLQSLGLVS